MALAERISNRTPNVTGKPCSIGALLEQLADKPEELAALRTMLGTRERPGWSQAEIYDALSAEGYVVGRQTVNRHRGGQCRCERDQ